MSDSIPLVDPARQAAPILDELVEAAERVIRGGRYILGSEVETFEREMSSILGVSHALGVASGTDALWLALKALGVSRGSRVALPAFTFFATASAVCNTGAAPILVDIEEGGFNIAAPELARVHAEDDLDAIVAVHLYGEPAAMDQILDAAPGVPVVEDCAQALGAALGEDKVGNLGAAGCFSFFPTKNLGGFGDGGLVTTGDAGLAERLRILRAHGSAKKYHHDLIGTNSRLDALQAALLRVKLRSLDDQNERRRKNAALYDEALAGVAAIQTPQVNDGVTHSFHQYTIRVRDGERDRLAAFLRDRDIATAIYYPAPLHLQPALAHLGLGRGAFPHSERAAEEVLSLPVSFEIAEDEIERVVDAIHAFFGGI